MLYEEIFVDRNYLRHGVTLREGDCVFDVGANIGLFTLFVYTECQQARVFAFEPLPQAFAKLQANVKHYALPVELYQCGLAAQTGSTQFTFYPKASAMSGRYADLGEDEQLAREALKNHPALLAQHADELMEGRFDSEQVECSLRTVSEVLKDQQLERIDLLKIDVEKSELDVLHGINHEDWKKIKQVVVEVHDKDGRLQIIRDLFEGHGFQVAIEQDELLRGTELFNLYAVHPSRDQQPPVATGLAKAMARLSPGVGLNAELRHHLQRRLPDYMLPSAFVFLPQLPLLPSGKVNRNALPLTGLVSDEPEEDMTAPRTAVEEVVAGIWADLLGREQVGVHANFFQSGGHSLMATQLTSRVREKFHTEVPLRMLFDSPTIAGFTLALIESEPTPGRVEKIAKLVQQVESMSDEEVSESLRNRNKRILSKV
jgi:FkbM family methyltransferase